MHHKSVEKLSFEQKVVIGILKGIKSALLFIFGLFSKNPTFLAKKPQPKAFEELNQKQKDDFGNRWREIEDLINLGGISQLRQALLEADKLIDFILKTKKVTGNTMGERLISAKPIFSYRTYNNLWNGHKLRNTLAHEAEREVLNHQIKESLKFYKDALGELRVL